MFRHQQQNYLLDFALEVESMEFGQTFDLSQQAEYFLGHLLVGESQVDDVLDEGEEQDSGRYAVCLGHLSEQSEAHFIGENGKVLVLEDFAGFDDFFAQDSVLFIDCSCDAFELFSEQCIMVQHLNI